EEQNSKLLVTTVGKLLFNEIIPTTFPYMNEPTINNLEEETPNGYFLEMGEDIVENIKARQLVSPFKKSIPTDIIAEVFNRYKISETSKLLVRMKDLGLYYSTRSRLTVGVSDIIVLPEKEELLEEAQEKVEAVLRSFRRGLITDGERHERVISIWSEIGRASCRERV